MAKYISPDEFIASTNGKEYDMDGSYGVQCVDGIKKFAYDVYGEYKFGCGNGWAYGLWTLYGSNGVEKYFNQHPFSEARKGDWIIWDWNSKSCKYSHVAMFVDMKTSDLVNSYGQSQNGIKAFNTCPIYTDGILGVLRPKIYEDSSIKYQVHVQSLGWQDWKYKGEIAGTVGKGKRMEAIRIDCDKEIYAKAHIQSYGWVDYGKITKDTIIGTTGQSKRLECLCLKGDFEYRVHIAKVGWTTWTKADGICTLGSVGQQLSLEAIQIR